MIERFELEVWPGKAPAFLRVWTKAHRGVHSNIFPIWSASSSFDGSSTVVVAPPCYTKFMHLLIRSSVNAKSASQQNGVFEGQMRGESNTQIRILVVDDNEPFRRFLSSILQRQENLQVIEEAQDGLQAVEQAGALQPDMILLDIGLPGLNGIEAARQIRRVASHSRIVFVTQESSPEVVEEALRMGAWGYVAKAQAGTDLLAAVEAVSHGTRFVSSSLNGHGDTGTT
jgi:CheY-like chemotaxis protein